VPLSLNIRCGETALTFLRMPERNYSCLRVAVHTRHHNMSKFYLDKMRPCSYIPQIRYGGYNERVPKGHEGRFGSQQG
jgi:hypothetical protein